MIQEEENIEQVENTINKKQSRYVSENNLNQKKLTIMNWYLAVLEKYFVFTGRARRSEYWYFILFNYMILISLAILGSFINMPLLSSIYSLAVAIPSIAAIVRRMHDVGKSGWYCFIPIYNLILACKEGYKGDNEYGPDPKENCLSFNQ